MPERVAHYELQESLGSGALGTTYRARDTRTGSVVALKTISPEIAGDADVAARVLREARIASQLHHPNIAQVSDYGEDAGTVYVVSELIEGESLRARLRRDGRLSEAETLRIALSAVHALIAADAQRVVHRNLRPENILLGQAGHVAVCDFGLTQARDVSLPTSLMPWIADPVYAAPEVSEGRAHVRSDLYSLGAILYEMLTGRAPDRSGAVEGNGISASDLAALRRCSRALTPIVRRLLQSQADRRYGSADELLSALMSVGRVESTLVTDDASPTRKRFGFAAGPGRAIAGGAAAVAGAAGGGVGAGSHAGSRLLGALAHGGGRGGRWLARGAGSAPGALWRALRWPMTRVAKAGGAGAGGLGRGARAGWAGAQGAVVAIRSRKVFAAAALVVVLAGGGGVFAMSAMGGGDDGGRHEGAVLGASAASATRAAGTQQPRTPATQAPGSGVIGDVEVVTPPAEASGASATPDAVAVGGGGDATGPQPAVAHPAPALPAAEPAGPPQPLPTSPPDVVPAIPPTWTPVPAVDTPTPRPTHVASSTPQATATPAPPTATPTPDSVTVAFVSDTSWTVYTNAALSNAVGAARVVCLRRTPSPVPANCPASALAWRDWDDDPKPWTVQLGAAQWIWAPGVTGNTTGADNANYFIAKCFNLPGTPLSGSVQVAVDWGADVFVNGSDSLAWADSDAQATTVDVGPYLHAGQNCISFQVYNEDACDSPCTYADNPAGLLVRGSLVYRPN